MLTPKNLYTYDHGRRMKGACGTLVPWILIFDNFLLTFHYKNVFLSLSSWQNKISPLFPTLKHALNHQLEKNTFNPMKKSFRRT